MATLTQVGQQVGQVGRSVPRLESRAKVSGSAEYVYHVAVPGMLHGKIVRSSVAHGRIRRLDASGARAQPGVYAVITGQDVLRVMPDPHYGPAFHDQPVLALDKVRFVGDPVAVVLAEDPHVAEEAAALVEVEYEELPAVFDELEAARPGAPLVHEVIRPATTFADLKHLAGRSGTNVAMEYHLRRGDVEEAFARADYVFEDVFRTQQTAHLPLEPFVCLAHPEGPDRLVIYTATQSPSFVRSEVARLLGWPENRVRVRTAFLGGGFGAKLYIKLEALAAACCLLAGRPVKITLSMEEQFLTITRHPTTFRIRSGVTRDGRIVARACEVWWNGGAYADISPRVTQKSGFTASGPYDIENVRIDSYVVYTNRPPTGALRGFGIPQLVWAYESHTDIIAHRLGMDPVEFRRINLLSNGQPHATGTPLTDTATREVLEALAKAMEWDKPLERGSGRYRRGRGIAIGLKACVAPTTSCATVVLYGDGSVAVLAGTVDMGQGSDTALAQIAAETLGLQAEQVRVVHPDTDVTPYDMATLGSRSLFHMGNAVKQAAEQVRDQLLAIAARALEADAEQLVVRDGAVWAPGGQSLSFKELMVHRFGMQAGTLVGTGTYLPPYAKPDPETGQSEEITPFWMVGGCGAEVEVDTYTGRVRVLRLVNAADVGRAINPAIVRTQLNGASLMQLGMTLMEEMVLEQGQVVNASLAAYKIPGFGDVPPVVEAVLVEMPHRHGPFGAKGVGETGTFAVSAAVANAIYDAVGVRIRELPITPERLLAALRRSGGAGSQEGEEG